MIFKINSSFRHLTHSKFARYSVTHIPDARDLLQVNTNAFNDGCALEKPCASKIAIGLWLEISSVFGPIGRINYQTKNNIYTN